MSSQTSEIPNFTPGSWLLGQNRCTVSWTVRHLHLHNVTGRVGVVDGTLLMTDDLSDAGVEATIDLTSVDTGSKGRDKAITSAKLLDTSRNKRAIYRSTGVRPSRSGQAGHFDVEGELTLLGVTSEVPLEVIVERFDSGPDGRGFPVCTARGSFSRKAFGFLFNVKPQFLNGLISDTVGLEIRVEGQPRP
jgi:polyisoprenoid-binding protein YceI